MRTRVRGENPKWTAEACQLSKTHQLTPVSSGSLLHLLELSIAYCPDMERRVIPDPVNVELTVTAVRQQELVVALD